MVPKWEYLLLSLAANMLPLAYGTPVSIDSDGLKTLAARSNPADFDTLSQASQGAIHQFSKRAHVKVEPVETVGKARPNNRAATNPAPVVHMNTNARLDAVMQQRVENVIARRDQYNHELAKKMILAMLPNDLTTGWREAHAEKLVTDLAKSGRQKFVSDEAYQRKVLEDSAILPLSPSERKDQRSERVIEDYRALYANGNPSESERVGALKKSLYRAAGADIRVKNTDLDTIAENLRSKLVGRWVYPFYRKQNKQNIEEALNQAEKLRA